MKEKLSNPLRIVYFGYKRIPSREGGVEIVVEKLATGVVKKGLYSHMPEPRRTPCRRSRVRYTKDKGI